jgi:hypothetical protein
MRICGWVVEHVAGAGSFVFGTQEVTVSTSAFNVNAVATMDVDADGWVDVV